MCTGRSGLCPSDLFWPTTTVCRVTTGVCDPAEMCTGNSPTCPDDKLLSNTTVCRRSTGVCDSAEACTGNSPTCPDDKLLSNTTECRASTGVCDPAEMCTGTSGPCPGDFKLPWTTVCRASTGPCDVADMCTGSSGQCPVDRVMPATSICRPPNGSCDAPEYCTGSSADCPADRFVNNGVQCSAGACSVPQICDGLVASCPAVFLPNGTMCRPPSQMCDLAEMCDGLSGQCPPDHNPLCPWAWISAPAPAIVIGYGEFCGLLSDDATVLVNITTDRVINFFVLSTSTFTAGSHDFLRSTVLVANSLDEPVLSFSSTLYRGWVYQPRPVFPIFSILNATNTSLTMNILWAHPPYSTMPQSVTLMKGAACHWPSLPAGSYCGTGVSSQYRSMVIQIHPKVDPSVDQTATFYSAFYDTRGSTYRFLSRNFSLTFISYNKASGDVYFTCPDDVSQYISTIVYNASTDSYSLFAFDLVTATSCPQALPTGYNCASISVPKDAKSMCIGVSSGNAISVQIDLTGIATQCRNVTATLTTPLWTIEPVPQCLQDGGISSVMYDFHLQSFAATYNVSLAVRRFVTSPACQSQASPLFCGSAGGWTYATQYASSVVSAAAISPAGSFVQSFQSGLLCQLGVPYSSGSWGNMSIGFVSFNGTNALLTNGSQKFTLSSSNCFQPSSMLSRFSGSAMFVTTTSKGVAVQHFASILVNATPTYADRFFSDIVVKISNATNLVCSLYARGLLVAGGSIIFAAAPSGTCDDTKINGVNFTGKMSQDGGIVTVGIASGPSALLSISIPTTPTNDPMPSGRYCKDSGKGDFVIVQQNTNGSTTVYSSVGGSLEQATLWTDLIDDGTTIVTRGATKVRFVNFSAEGYGVSISGAQQLLSAQACNILPSSPSTATGQFCGVTYDSNPNDIDPNSPAFMGNTSFATLTVTWNQASTIPQYSIQLFASRRLSPSQPLSLTFNDHPWLIPFRFPGTQLLLTSNDTSSNALWTLSFADQLGPMSVSLSSALCGSNTVIISGGTVCGTPTLQGTSLADLQVFVNITSRSLVDITSLSLTLALLNVTNRSRTSFSSISTAVVIDGKIMYWAGANQPVVMVAEVDSASISLVGLYGGSVSSRSCPQLLHSDKYYCGTNVSAPWTLIVGAGRGAESSFFISIGSGSGFGRLTVYWLPPLNMAGMFSVTQTVGPLGITALQYFSTNDSYVLTTDTSISPTASIITLSRGKCNAALLPDGEYCGAFNTTSAPSFKLSVRNGTVFTRLPSNPSVRVKCVGMQSAAGGLYDCMGAPISSFSVETLDTSIFDYYYQPFGQAALSYSGGAVKASFSQNGGISYLATLSSCEKIPQLFQTFTGASMMQSSMFSNNTRLAVNGSGTVFVADVDRSCIFTVDPSSGFVQVFAGQCDTAGYADGAAGDALFNTTVGIVFDSSGILYVMDAGNARVRAVARNGDVTTMSGNGDSSSVDNVGLGVSYLDLAGATVHPTSGRLYISEAYRIRILNPAANSVKTYLGSTGPGYVNGSGTKALLNRPGKATFTSDGLTMYFVDSGNNCLRKVSSTSAVVTVASGVVGIGGFLSSMPMFPQTALVDWLTGNVLIADNGHLWLYMTVSGVVSTYDGPNALVTPNASDLVVFPAYGKTLFVGDGPRVHALSR